MVSNQKIQIKNSNQELQSKIQIKNSNQKAATQLDHRLL